MNCKREHQSSCYHEVIACFIHLPLALRPNSSQLKNLLKKYSLSVYFVKLIKTLKFTAAITKLELLIYDGIYFHSFSNKCLPSLFSSGHLLLSDFESIPLDAYLQGNCTDLI